MAPQALACDYSFARPSPSAIAAAGYVAVIRYLSTDPSKNLSVSERDALWAAGLGIGLVWETTADRATQGADAGTQDEAAAAAQARSLGVAPSAPIFYAVDEDVPWSSVAAYFDGIRAAHAYPIGVYGSAVICQGAAEAGIPWRFQTEAWSGTTVLPVAQLYQRVTPTRTIAGATLGDWDEDVVLVEDFPWWRPGAPPSRVTTPAAPSVSASVRSNGGGGEMIIRTTTTGAAYLVSGGKTASVVNGQALAALQAAGCGVAELTEPAFRAISEAFA